MSSEEANQSGDKSTESQTRDFGKVIRDFIRDLTTTFPEICETLNADLKAIKEDDGDVEKHVKAVREHCVTIFPQRFFDILYQNEELFDGDDAVILLPGIDFRPLWKENISDSTRETMWKYLQLILFTVVSDVSDSSSFGDTAKLFEAIDEGEFKSKLEDTIKQMEDVFEGAGIKTDASGVNVGDLPDPSVIHERVAGMMGGKLGKLAKEIAEETAEEMNIDLEAKDGSSVQDVFQKLFKNPTKLMGLVKKVGGKLDDKIKSGEIKESELMAEASEMLSQMKDMPGMANIQQMIGKMGKGKMNMGAMQAQLDRNMKTAQMKERMRARARTAPAQATSREVDPAEIEAANKAVAELLKAEGFDGDLESYVWKPKSGGGAEKSSRKQSTGGGKKKKGKRKGKGGK